MPINVSCTSFLGIDAVFTPLQKHGLNPNAEGSAEQTITWPVQYFRLTRSVGTGAQLGQLRCLSVYTTQLGEQAFFPQSINLYTKLSEYLVQRLVRVQLKLIYNNMNQTSAAQIIFRGIISGCSLASAASTAGSQSTVVLSAVPYLAVISANRFGGDWYYGPSADSPNRRATYVQPARTVQRLRAGAYYSGTNKLWQQRSDLNRTILDAALKQSKDQGIHLLDFLNGIYTSIQNNYNRALHVRAPVDSIYNYMSKVPNTRFMPDAVKPGSSSHTAVNKQFIRGVGAQAVSTMLTGTPTTVLSQWQMDPFMLLQLVPTALADSKAIHLVKLEPRQSPLGKAEQISQIVNKYSITGIQTTVGINMTQRPDTYIVHMALMSSTISDKVKNKQPITYGDVMGIYYSDAALQDKPQRRKNINAPNWLSTYANSQINQDTANNLRGAKALADQFAQMLFAQAYLTQSTLRVSGPIQLYMESQQGITVPFDNYIGKKVAFTMPQALTPIAGDQVQSGMTYTGIVQDIQLQYAAGSTSGRPTVFTYMAQLILTQDTGNTIQNTIYKTDQK